MTAREEVLARIRTALRDRPRPAPVARDYRTAGTPDGRRPAELAALLADRLADYGARVHRLAGAGGADADLPRAVAAALRERGAGRVLVPAGLNAAWLSAIPDVADVEVVPDDPPLQAQALDALDAVVTTCAVAIAETGTLVLDGGPGQGRRAATLVPDYHLVVVPAECIVGGVPAAVERLDPARPLTWISGPSATSDIELERVGGVHGPRTLEVVLTT